MSAHDIIMAMVEGLKNPKTKINMNTYGEIREDVCFGCAATNAILHIMDANEDEVKSHVTDRSSRYAHPERMLDAFECAIDSLRCGYVFLYNYLAPTYRFAPITPMPGQELPKLGDDYTDEQLQEYVKLAEYNKIKEA